MPSVSGVDTTEKTNIVPEETEKTQFLPEFVIRECVVECEYEVDEEFSSGSVIYAPKR